VESEHRAYRTLGVYFDEHLTLNIHVEYLLSKLSRALFMLNRVKNILPSHALKSVYYALFHCHLLYCPTVLSCTSNANNEKIKNYKKKPSASSLMLITMPTLLHFSLNTTSYHSHPLSNNPNYNSCIHTIPSTGTSHHPLMGPG
jgi:hypothetical protein